MHRRSRIVHLVSIAALGFTTAAFAQEATDPQAPVGSTSPVGETASSDPAVAAAEPGAAAAAVKPRDLSAPMYGIAARWRYIMVPGWFLDFFTQKNVPLYTAGSFALEGFRRKVDKDDPNRTWELAVGVGYQNMSPPDGYWLGKGKDPAQDADMVQARSLSLITMDAAFISRQYFNPYFGIHYGAGLGLGIVRGKILRTSAQYNPSNKTYTVQSGGTEICHANATCNETQLNQTEGQADGGPSQPHRFQETSVPGALPIINLLIGLDGRVPLPNNQSLEFRLEGGFFDAFFVGLTMGYVI
jgi:hypothetical protein